MRAFTNSELVSCINLGFDPNTLTISTELRHAVERSLERVQKAVEDKLSEDTLLAKETEVRTEIESSFGDGTWKKNLPGREILRQFVSAENIPTNYETFRNLIVTRMVEANFKPDGMRIIIEKICADGIGQGRSQ